MSLHIFRNTVRHLAIACIAGITFSGCNLLEEDLEPCPAYLQLRFEYTYHLKKDNAFSEVGSINVWAFDHSTGTFVWSGEDSGEDLKQPDYTMKTPLEAGTYDFVVWGGLKDNADFNLATYTPSSKEELEVKLKTIAEDGVNVSRSHLPGLYHGYLANVVHSVDPLRPSITTGTVSLIKDTNDIAMMLCNQNGNALDTKNFTVQLNYADAWLAWDNAVMTGSPEVSYRPWSYLYGTGDNDPLSKAAGDDDDNSSIILYEMSSSRLMADDYNKAWLDVYRNSDNKRIIHFPLIRYLLLERGERFKEYEPQEYLDRRDDYSLLFFVDDDNDYNLASIIYINGWAVVPTQGGDL